MINLSFSLITFVFIYQYIWNLVKIIKRKAKNNIKIIEIKRISKKLPLIELEINKEINHYKFGMHNNDEKLEKLYED